MSEEDVLGEALLDAWRGKLRAPLLLARDDGRVLTIDVARWLTIDLREGARAIASRVSSGQRVLDVGCGAGAQALALQQRGARVTALDMSSGALAIATRRGLSEVVHAAIGDPRAAPGPFEAITLFGNNLGIAGTLAALPAFLASLTSRLAERGAVLADVSCGGVTAEARLRLRYGERATAWFPWLWVSFDDLSFAAEEVGAHATRLAETPLGYVAALSVHAPV